MEGSEALKESLSSADFDANRRIADVNGNGGGCDESGVAKSSLDDVGGGFVACDGDGLSSSPVGKESPPEENAILQIKDDQDPLEVKHEASQPKLEPLDPDDQVESDLSDSSCSDPGGDSSVPSRYRAKNMVVIPEFHMDSSRHDEDGEERTILEADGRTVLETDFSGIFCIEGRPRTYVCTHCSYSSHHSGHVKRHVMSVHDKVKFPCNLCDHQSTTIYHLKRHILARHEEVRFACDLCKFSSKKRANLKRHYTRSHGQTLSNLTQHTQLPQTSATDVKLCDKCEYFTTDTDDLKHHMKEEHNQAVSIVIANQEEKGVYLKEKETVSIREEDGRFSCEQCEYSASLRGSVSRHIRNVHQGLRYPCDQCDYQATRSHHLKRHKERIHFENVTIL